jgi:hypothetical protein
VRKYLDRWARQLIRRGIRSGLIEGSNLWLSIGAIAWLLRFLSRRQAPEVSTERLRLGESVVVTHVPAPPRSRRAKKKAARKLAKQSERQAKKEASRRYLRAAERSARRQAEAERAPGRARGHRRRQRRAETGPGPDEGVAEDAT